MALPISFRWDEEFVARIDAARGDVPRSVWVRRAVERALSGELVGVKAQVDGRQVVLHPDDVQLVRSSAQAKRDVRPIPKGKP